LEVKRRCLGERVFVDLLLKFTPPAVCLIEELSERLSDRFVFGEQQIDRSCGLVKAARRVDPRAELKP
jgi:hypothetical protein